MMLRSLLLSCSFLGFLGGGAVIAMEDDNQRSQNSITLKKEEILGETTKDEKELKQNRLLKQYNITDPKEIEIFKEFYNGTLLYYPYDDSYKGKVELSISDLEDPLNGEFDLSKCNGEYQVSPHLSIKTGYPKETRPENKDKVEIWIAPWFLIARDLETTAAYLKPIFYEQADRLTNFGIFRVRAEGSCWVRAEGSNKNLIKYAPIGNRRFDPMGDVVWSSSVVTRLDKPQPHRHPNYPRLKSMSSWDDKERFLKKWREKSALENSYEERFKKGFFMFTLTKQEKKEETRQAAQLLKDPSLSPAALPKAALDEPTSLKKPKASASTSSPSKSSEDKDTVPAKAKDAMLIEAKDAVPAKAKGAMPAKAKDAMPAKAKGAMPAKAKAKGQKRKKTVLFRIG